MSQTQVPKGWELSPIPSVIKIIDYRGRTPPYSDEGILHIRSTNIKNGKIIWEKMKFVSPKTYEKYMTRGLPQKGDLLLTTEAPMGEIAEVPKEKISLAQRIMLLRPSQKIFPRFLMYQIMSPGFQSKLHDKKTGAVVKGISSRHFQTLEIILPNIEIQKKIVQKLDYVFEQLEEKKKQILHRMSKFDSEKIHKTYQNHLLKLAFSGVLIGEKLEDSEGNKIQIPKGWKLKKLYEVCDTITSGGTPSRSNNSFFGGNIPWLKIGDLNDGLIKNSEEKITRAGLENSSAKIFPKNTILIAMYGATIGKTGILGIECATNQAICGLICGKCLKPEYLHYYLKKEYFNIRKKAMGMAQPNINQDKIKNLEILIPPLETQKKIVKILDTKFKEWNKYRTSIENIEKQYKKSKKYIENISNSILNSAFSGKLVN